LATKPTGGLPVNGLHAASGLETAWSHNGFTELWRIFVDEPLGDLAILRDNKRYLEMRVTRLDTGMAWAEDPPSRTRHLIGFVFFSLTLACARETKKTQPK
jgi:hypothetical protein